jgi:hypothetical protein
MAGLIKQCGKAIEFGLEFLLMLKNTEVVCNP